MILFFRQVQVCFFIQYSPRMSIARTQSSTIHITGGQSMQMGILNSEKSFTLGMSAHILKANMFYRKIANSTRSWLVPALE